MLLLGCFVVLIFVYYSLMLVRLFAIFGIVYVTCLFLCVCLAVLCFAFLVICLICLCFDLLLYFIVL